MRNKVGKFIKNCVSCQQNKYSIYAKYKEVQVIELPIALQINIIIDFIIQLPRSKNSIIEYSFNLIFIIVDRFTKYTKIIPFRHSYTAKQLAYIFKD